MNMAARRIFNHILLVLVAAAFAIGGPAQALAHCDQRGLPAGTQQSCCRQPGELCHCSASSHSGSRLGIDAAEQDHSGVARCPCTASPEPRNNPAPNRITRFVTPVSPATKSVTATSPTVRTSDFPQASCAAPCRPEPDPSSPRAPPF